MLTFLTSLEFAHIFTIFLPLFGVVFALSIRSENIRDGLLIGTGVLLFLSVLNLLYLAYNYNLPTITLAEPLPGLSITFAMEPLGMIFALVASFLWPVTMLYSVGYMRKNNEKHQPRFYAFFSVAIFATIALSMANNLLTMYIFYEMLTLSTYPLVTHSQTRQARNAGRLYLGMLLTTSIGLFLPAIIWTYTLAGTVDFEIGGILAYNASPTTTGILLFMFVFGIGKAALMPLHRWLPAAMIAPTPVSALLHAVAVVKAGVFCILKIIAYIFDTRNLLIISDTTPWVTDWLIYVAGATVILASIIALRQENLKKLLAYSTISQLSYVVLGASLFTPVAVAGAVMHIAAHAVSKITLFFAA
ncbi:MAG: cation:proton antiporter, partial [Rickettsiales bacterium]|nr:cation:proton antiporter [Rickettsiales bacterium]